MLEKITENIYYMLNNDEMDRPALGLIIGEKYSMIVDAGDSKEHALEMQNELKLMNIPAVKYVVLTHHHMDHIGGISSWDAITIASNTTVQCMKSECSEEFLYENPIDIQYHSELVIDLGNYVCNIREIVNPHRMDGTIIHVEKENVLFVGDAAYGRNANGSNYYERDKVLEMMNKIESYQCDYVLCSHESICDKEEMADYFNNIKKAEEITRGCDNIDEAIKEYTRKYDSKPSKDEMFYINSFFRI